MLFISCSAKIGGGSDDNNINSRSKKDTSETINADNSKMLIGAWEVDSISTDGVMDRNYTWVEIFNYDSTYCFHSNKEVGVTCNPVKNGSGVLYGIGNGIIFQYDINWDRKRTYAPYAKRKIIEFTDSILIYQMMDVKDKEQIRYLHRIR